MSVILVSESIRPTSLKTAHQINSDNVLMAKTQNAAATLSSEPRRRLICWFAEGWRLRSSPADTCRAVAGFRVTIIEPAHAESSPRAWSGVEYRSRKAFAHIQLVDLILVVSERVVSKAAITTMSGTQRFVGLSIASNTAVWGVAEIHTVVKTD